MKIRGQGIMIPEGFWLDPPRQLQKHAFNQALQY